MAKAKKKSRAQEGPGAGRRRPGLRGALHGKKDQEVGRCGEEGGQEGGQQPEEGRAQAGALMPLPQAEQDAERSSSGHRSFPDSTFYAI